MKISGIRATLKAGAFIFGISAIALLMMPKMFLDLLGSDSTDQMQWAMRMIGITLIALAGNMYQNSKNPNERSVLLVAGVMCVSAFALGVLTLLIPNPLTWFGYLYAIIGFGFSVAYLTFLVQTFFDRK